VVNRKVKVLEHTHRPASIDRLSLPERSATLGRSVRDAERELERAAQGDVLDLTYADTRRFPPPSWAIEDLVAAATGGGASYTPYRGDRAVRERVATNVSGFLGVDIDPARNLLLTPGTQAGLFAALAALIDPGDRVLLVDPDYLASERMLRYLGAEVVPIPLIWEGVDRPTIDLDALIRALALRPRLLLLSHPNNPTGAVFEAAVIRELAQLAREAGLYIVIDELYARLVYDGQPFHHLIAEEDMQERCVTLLGPSKTESMSGFRLGVAVAPADVADRMEDVLSITALRAPAYAQHALVRWLAEDREFVAQRVRDYQQLRDETVERTNQSGLLQVPMPQGTAYMFPRLVDRSRSDQEVGLHLVREAQVLINPGYQFGERGSGHFRICFAQDERVWNGALDRMITALS
jgi:aspartate/methionine/tyrosine aminotransferase